MEHKYLLTGKEFDKLIEKKLWIIQVEKTTSMFLLFQVAKKYILFL